MGQVKELIEYIFNTFKIFVTVNPWQVCLITRNGKIKKVVNGGIYFKIPFLDRFFIQENRLRVELLSMQTLSTLDNKTLTIACSIGYSINDIQKYYMELYHPQSTLCNIVSSKISYYIFCKNSYEISPNEIENNVLKMIDFSKFGVNLESIKITDFSFVRTYRLLQDKRWENSNESMNKMI